MDTDTLYDVAYWAGQAAAGMSLVFELANPKTLAGTL